MRRYELSDEQWEKIADLFPSNEGKLGAPWKNHRQLLNGMFWAAAARYYVVELLGEIYQSATVTGTASAAEPSMTDFAAIA